MSTFLLGKWWYNTTTFIWILRYKLMWFTTVIFNTHDFLSKALDFMNQCFLALLYLTKLPANIVVHLFKSYPPNLFKVKVS